MGGAGPVTEDVAEAICIQPVEVHRGEEMFGAELNVQLDVVWNAREKRGQLVYILL